MIPKVELAKSGIKICRMICGTNAFMGISHFTISQNMFLSEYFSSADKIAEIMSYLMEEFGVNSCISSPRDKIYDAIQIVQKETGEKYHWICTPGNDRITAKDVKTGILNQVKWCADHEVTVCMPHRSFVDSRMDSENNEIHEILPVLNFIRDLGMLTGLSTHYYEAIQIVKSKNLDVDLIIQPLNTLGFQSNIEVNTLINAIKNTKTQIIVIKPMAAGRLLPEIGLNFAFNNIKKNDLVAVGVDCIQNADYDAQIVENLLNNN